MCETHNLHLPCQPLVLCCCAEGGQAGGGIKPVLRSKKSPKPRSRQGFTLLCSSSVQKWPEKGKKPSLILSQLLCLCVCCWGELLLCWCLPLPQAPACWDELVPSLPCSASISRQQSQEQAQALPRHALLQRQQLLVAGCGQRCATSPGAGVQLCPRCL